MSPGTDLERLPPGTPGALVSVEAMAATVHRLFVEGSDALFPVETVTVGADGQQIEIRVTATVCDEQHRFAARVLVPERIGDPLWDAFARDAENLETWASYAVYVLFVEAAETGGRAPGNRDSEGVHWLDIWNQFPDEDDHETGDDVDDDEQAGSVS